MPSRALFVSADHGMFIDGVLVPAGLLALCCRDEPFVEMVIADTRLEQARRSLKQKARRVVRSRPPT